MTAITKTYYFTCSVNIISFPGAGPIYQLVHTFMCRMVTVVKTIAPSMLVGGAKNVKTEKLFWIAFRRDDDQVIYQVLTHKP